MLSILTLKKVLSFGKELKGGHSDLGTKILQKVLKIILILPKPFNPFPNDKF